MWRASFLFLLIQICLGSASALSLKEYLEQVTNQNKSAEASEQTRLSGLETARDAKLLLAPNLFFTPTFQMTKVPPQTPSTFNYDEQSGWATKLGVRKQFEIGLQGEVGYEYNRFNVKGGTFGTTALEEFHITSDKPYLSLRQPLWSNGFGRQTKAQVEQLDAAGKGKSLGAQFQKESLLIQAEVLYWQLAATRKQIEFQTQALAQSKRIWEWNIRRRSNNLNQNSDLLQAKAAYERNSLELQRSVDQERQLAQNFNALRFVDSAEVKDSLDELPELDLLKLPNPQQSRPRTDVLAAEQTMRMAKASAISSLERDKPKLDVFGQYSTTTTDMSIAIVPKSSNKPTTVIGVEFNMPLDFESMKMAQQGYRRDEMAARSNYEQQKFNEQKDWKDLQAKFGEAQRRFQMSTQLEETQQAKMMSERDQFRNGRTTTFQVLNFEQEYLSSRVNRINSELDLLTLITQMKLYQNQAL